MRACAFVTLICMIFFDLWKSKLAYLCFDFFNARYSLLVVVTLKPKLKISPQRIGIFSFCCCCCVVVDVVRTIFRLSREQFSVFCTLSLFFLRILRYFAVQQWHTKTVLLLLLVRLLFCLKLEPLIVYTYLFPYLIYRIHMCTNVHIPKMLERVLWVFLALCGHRSICMGTDKEYRKWLICRVFIYNFQSAQ